MATGTTEFIDNTTAEVFIPEKWSQDAIVARKQRVVFAGLVNTQYKAELNVGDTLHVPSRGHMTQRTKSANAAITYETITETNTDITVTTHNYSALAVESITKLQANRDLQRFYADEMGYVLDLAVDDALAALIDAFTQTVGTLAAALSYADLLESTQLLDDANAPQENRVVVISPAEKANVMQLDHFINNDYDGLRSGGMNFKPGDRLPIGTWMGMPIYVTTNVDGSNAAGHDNVMMHHEALALVQQMMPMFHTQYDIDYFCDKVAAEQVYGVKEMRDDHGVWLKAA